MSTGLDWKQKEHFWLCEGHLQAHCATLVPGNVDWPRYCPFAAPPLFLSSTTYNNTSRTIRANESRVSAMCCMPRRGERGNTAKSLSVTRDQCRKRNILVNKRYKRGTSMTVDGNGQRADSAYNIIFV